VAEMWQITKKPQYFRVKNVERGLKNPHKIKIFYNLHNFKIKM